MEKSNAMLFTKMQALGNDYLVINNLQSCLVKPEAFAKQFCDRHVGVGADGVILVKPSVDADFKMELYNPDGSRPQMCGNGIRCFAKYVYEKKLTDKRSFFIETDAGIRSVTLGLEGKRVKGIQVDMGEPILKTAKIPIVSDREMVVREQISVLGREYQMTGVSMGNPHIVIWVKDVAHFPVEQIGSCLECHPRFPQRVNIEFAQILNSENVTMRVWERGVGETLSCGTGACAVCVAGVLCGLTANQITVRLKRGHLKVKWNQRENQVYLSGGADLVFEGEIPETD